MDQKWDDNVATLHGVVTRDFPNFFLPPPNQAGVGPNYNGVLNNGFEHVAYIVKEAAARTGRGFNFVVEPTKDAEEAWTMEVLQRAASFAAMAGCTPNYFNNEGERDRVENKTPEKRMKAARGAIWGCGVIDFASKLEAWRQNGKMEGLEITPV